MTETRYIYALADPRDGRVRYIGKTRAPFTRLAAHLRDGDTSSEHPKAQWLGTLKKWNLQPSLLILEVVPRDLANTSEQRWIRHFAITNTDLTNIRVARRCHLPIPVDTHKSTATTSSPLDWRQFGNRLRERREARRLSQEQAAQQVGRVQSYVSNLENRRNQPGAIELVAQLASLYGTTADYLLGLTDDPAPAQEAERVAA